MNYRVISRWSIVLDLEVPGRGQARNQDQLLLVPGAGPLNERYETAEVRCCWFERF